MWRGLSVVLLSAGCAGGGPNARPEIERPEPADVPLDAPATASAAPSAAPGPAAYATRSHPGAGVAFDLGTTWKLTGVESATLLAASPDGQAVLMFHVADPETLDEALTAIRKALASDVEDAYFGPAAKKELSTMTAELSTGAGKLEGRPVELGQLLVATPTGKVLIVVAVIEAAAPTASKKQARHTLESIRPEG